MDVLRLIKVRGTRRQRSHNTTYLTNHTMMNHENNQKILRPGTIVKINCKFIPADYGKIIEEDGFRDWRVQLCDPGYTNYSFNEHEIEPAGWLGRIRYRVQAWPQN